MEVAIPVIALGAMYVISNQKNHMFLLILIQQVTGDVIY